MLIPNVYWENRSMLKKERDELCDRLGHPIHLLDYEEPRVCPRCNRTVSNLKTVQNPLSVGIEEFNKVSKVKILGAKDKLTFSNTIKTEEIK